MSKGLKRNFVLLLSLAMLVTQSLSVFAVGEVQENGLNTSSEIVSQDEAEPVSEDAAKDSSKDISKDISENTAEDAADASEIISDENSDPEDGEETAGLAQSQELQWIKTTGVSVNRGAFTQVCNAGEVVYDRVAGAEHYMVKVYKSDDLDTPVDTFGASDDGHPEGTVKITGDHFSWEPRESGSYTFTVTASSSNPEENSVATSDVWVYTAPSKQLGTPVISSVSWDTSAKTVSWDAVEGAERYFIAYYYTNGSSEHYPCGEGCGYFTEANGRVIVDLTNFGFAQDIAEDNSADRIYIRVRAVTTDMNTIRSGELSGYSAPVSYNEIKGDPVGPVPVYATGISLVPAETDMLIGESLTIEASYEPANTTDRELVWESTNPAVATVSDGKVTAVSAGTVTIIARTKANPEVEGRTVVHVKDSGSVPTPGPDPEPAPVSRNIIAEGTKKNYSWKFYEDGELYVEAISGKLSETDVPWKAYLDSITSLEVTDGVRVIAGTIFYNMPALAEATIPSTLDVKGNKGYFYNCPMLEKVFISEEGQYTQISDNIIAGQFKKGTGIMVGTKTATNLPESGVDRVYTRAFYGQALPYVVIPSNITVLNPGAFAQCRQMSFAVIQNTSLTVEDDAFEGCSNLKDVYFAGDAKQWKKVCANSKILKAANVHYGESDPELVYISFSTNGGSNVARQTVIKGRTVAELPETYRDKYVQDGWYTDSSLTQAFEPGKTKVNEDITLYAKWREAKQVKVNFYSRKDEKGNWIKVAESSVYEKQFVTEPKLEEPEGEEFAGWYRTEDYSDDGFSVHQRVTEDMELFARWISSDETVTKKSGELGSGEISYELEYTPEVIYDGRKHVVSEVNGKKTAETASVNPDINVSNFKVLINGEKVSGITIKKFTYANNKLPSYDGVTNNPMFIYPVLKYDTSDQGYRDAIAANPDLKKVLNKMMKPTYNKKNEEWNYEPITVDIHRITLSSETPVYTKADLNSNAELKKTDGILVWNGGRITYKTKKYGRGEDAQTYTLKATAKGLYYQRVFEIGSKKVVKKLTLRPGEWTVKTAREDGEIYRYLAMKTKAFDYYVGEDGELLLNGDTETWSSDVDTGSSGSIKAGYFDGDLPDLNATE